MPYPPSTPETGHHWSLCPHQLAQNRHSLNEWMHSSESISNAHLDVDCLTGLTGNPRPWECGPVGMVSSQPWNEFPRDPDRVFLLWASGTPLQGTWPCALAHLACLPPDWYPWAGNTGNTERNQIKQTLSVHTFTQGRDGACNLSCPRELVHSCLLF